MHLFTEMGHLKVFRRTRPGNIPGIWQTSHRTSWRRINYSSQKTSNRIERENLSLISESYSMYNPLTIHHNSAHTNPFWSSNERLRGSSSLFFPMKMLYLLMIMNSSIDKTKMNKPWVTQYTPSSNWCVPKRNSIFIKLYDYYFTLTWMKVLCFCEAP